MGDRPTDIAMLKIVGEENFSVICASKIPLRRCFPRLLFEKFVALESGPLFGPVGNSVVKCFVFKYGV